MSQAAERSRAEQARAALPMPANRATRPPGPPLRTALGVALAAVGCAPPGPRAPLSATQGMRSSMAVGNPSGARISFLRAGNPAGPCVVLVHGTPGSASGWADFRNSSTSSSLPDFDSRVTNNANFIIFKLLNIIMNLVIITWQK